MHRSTQLASNSTATRECEVDLQDSRITSASIVTRVVFCGNLDMELICWGAKWDNHKGEVPNKLADTILQCDSTAFHIAGANYCVTSITVGPLNF